jgi:hypothetical protein
MSTKRISQPVFKDNAQALVTIAVNNRSPLGAGALITIGAATLDLQAIEEPL